MRLVALGSVPLVLAGCGAKYKPTGPVMGDYERSFNYPVHRPFDELRYNGSAPATEAPVLPVMAFGAAFDLDVALMPTDDDLDMIEFARLNVPFGNGYVWMAMETQTGSGAQTLLANLDPEVLASLMPEVPLTRRVTTMEIEDRTTETTVDLHLAYEGTQGKIDATILGDTPLKTERRRNGRTFSHSQNELLAVLDIPASESLFKADVTLDGKNVAYRKIAGVVPGQFVLSQVQGGLASGTFSVIPTEPAAGGAAWGKVTFHAPGAGEVTVKPSPDVLVKSLVATNFTVVQECWKTRLAAQADLAGGTLGFEWNVDRGAVKDVKVKPIDGQTFQDEALSKCVIDAVSAWAFDPTVHGAVWWSYTFSPGDADEGTDPFVTLGEGGSTLTEAPAPASSGTRPPEPPPVPAMDSPEYKAWSEAQLAKIEELKAQAKDVTVPEAPKVDAPEFAKWAQDTIALLESKITPPASSGTRPTEDDLPDGDGASAPVVAEAPEASFKSFTTLHAYPDGSKVEMKWLVSRQGDRVTASQTNDLRTIDYHFRVSAGTYLELVAVTVEQYGRATPVTSITFNPPLPDFRWSFNGKRTSDFVIDVNGQQNYAYGEATSYWTESGPRLAVDPTAPEWARARPMLTEVVYQKDGTTSITIQRTGGSGE